jgi:hypothetical protein
MVGTAAAEPSGQGPRRADSFCRVGRQAYPALPLADVSGPHPSLRIVLSLSIDGYPRSALRPIVVADLRNLRDLELGQVLGQ